MPSLRHPEPDSFTLPANDIPDSTLQRLSPWVAGFVGLTQSQATERLHKRWESIENESLMELRDTLAKFEVRAIVDYGEGGQIYAVRSNAPDEDVGNVLFLPAPLQEDELEARLVELGLTRVTGLKEFLRHFGGLAEDTIMAGQFVSGESDWPTFTDSMDGLIEGFDEWKDSLMLYHARNGCHLLVRHDGKVAWYVMQEAVVRDFAASFPDFVRQFSDHRKIAWPFDPYPPTEDDDY